MRWNSEELESLRLKEWSETKAERKATLGAVKGRVQQGWTEKSQVRVHSEENGPGPPHIPA